MNLLERLFSYTKRKAKTGLASMQVIDAWLGHPHRKFSTIHIAGTNGKGSVSLKIASALQEAGYRVGLYTSPHIETVRERIQVNREMISEEYLSNFLPELFSFVERKSLEVSFFDLLTALGFAYFAEKNVDYGVIEVGLGGRFDATNVITPILSVITSIAKDHCELLGNTLEEIAFEKAGIIKEGVPVVIGPRACYDPILSAAQDKGVLVAPQKGFYDRENSAIARAALQLLAVPEQAIEKGILRRPPCRFEEIDSQPIILDVAHNPDGFERLAEALQEVYPEKKFHLLLAMGKEKDAKECVEKIAPLLSQISCFSNGHERLLSAQDLQNSLDATELKVSIASSLEEFFSSSEPLLVCGTFFIMGDIQRRLGAVGRLKLR